jgi:hypothetical protein
MPAPSVKCTLTLVQAPEIRGLRLGMNLEQAMSIFPSLRRPPEVIELPDGRRLTRNFLEPDELGIIRVRINSLDPKFSSEMSKLEGISSINFDFMDGHISYLFVFYDTEAKWNTVDDFALRVSEDLHIPKAWKKPTDYKRDLERDLECEGFVITVSSDRYPVISMKDLGAEQIVKNRKAEMERAKEKKNRDDWKP